MGMQPAAGVFIKLALPAELYAYPSYVLVSCDCSQSLPQVTVCQLPNSQDLLNFHS